MIVLAIVKVNARLSACDALELWVNEDICSTPPDTWGIWLSCKNSAKIFETISPSRLLCLIGYEEIAIIRRTLLRYVKFALWHESSVCRLLHSVNNRPVKRLPLSPMLSSAASGLLYCTACRMELWDIDTVFIARQHTDARYWYNNFVRLSETF